MGRRSSSVNEMPIEKAFRPGSQILLEWFDPQGVYHSARTMLQDVGEQGMCLEAPIERRMMVRIEPGTEITLACHRKSDSVVAVVRVTELKPGTPPLLLTTLPQATDRTTQRRFYRVDVDLPVAFENGGGRMLNLSGSGCLLRWEEADAPDPGHQVAFDVKLPSFSLAMSLAGRVVRSYPSRDRAAVDFVGLTRAQQDELVRYVFLRQNELLRLGMLRPDPAPATPPDPDS